MAIELHSSIAVHPGAWLKRNVTSHYGLTVTEVAENLKVTRQAMSNLLNGKSGLSADMAIRFEKAFGIPADTLVRMQVAHEMAQARSHEDEIDVQPLRELIAA